MTPKEIRHIEREHMGSGTIRFRYQGRFLVCDQCQSRFRMRYNGTLRFVEPKS